MSIIFPDTEPKTLPPIATIFQAWLRVSAIYQGIHHLNYPQPPVFSADNGPSFGSFAVNLALTWLVIKIFAQNIHLISNYCLLLFNTFFACLGLPVSAPARLCLAASLLCCIYASRLSTNYKRFTCNTAGSAGTITRAKNIGARTRPALRGGSLDNPAQVFATFKVTYRNRLPTTS